MSDTLGPNPDQMGLTAEETSVKQPVDANAATLQSTDTDILVGNLAQEAATLLSQDRKSPEFNTQSLKLMSDLEQAREKLGNYCVTLGEGEDRAVVLLGQLTKTKTTPMILDIEPNRVQGMMITTDKERILVNKSGVFAIINTVDQTFDYSAEPVRGGNGSERNKDWEDRYRPLVQYAGETNERLLQKMFSSGKLTTLDDIPKHPVSGSGKQVFDEWREKYGDAYEKIAAEYNVSEYTLSPRRKDFAMTDQEYDRAPVKGWRAAPSSQAGTEFGVVRITEPGTISTALKTSIPQTTNAGAI